MDEGVLMIMRNMLTWMDYTIKVLGVFKGPKIVDANTALFSLSDSKNVIEKW